MQENKDYKRPIPWLDVFVQDNFPFIAQDFDSLTLYEKYQKIVHYLNHIIEKCNLTSDEVVKLTDLINSIKDYVNNYFDNLDVQEEINKKLDEMLQDGTLQDIIRNATYNKIEDFVLYAFFDDYNNSEIKFYVSRDNIHLQQIITKNKIYGRDPSIAYYKGKFLVAVTDSTGTDYDFRLYVSTDLENWKTYYVNLGVYNEQYHLRWAPSLFVDDNGDLYVFISVQYGISDNSSMGVFHIYKSKCINADNFDFENAQMITITNSSSTNLIDPDVIKINGVYHLFCKNHNNDKQRMEHYISNDLQIFALENDNYSNLGIPLEGMFIYKFKDYFYIAGERYSEDNLDNKGTYRITKTKDLVNFANYKIMQNNNESNMSHGDGIVITDPNAKNIITSFNSFAAFYDIFDDRLNKNYMSAYNTRNENNNKGRYLKLLSIYPQAETGGCASNCLFQLTEGVSQNFSSIIEFVGRIRTYEPFESLTSINNQISYLMKGNTGFNYNMLGKIISIPNVNEKCWDLYLDLNYYDYNIRPMIKVLAGNGYNDKYKIYSDVFTDTLPVSVTDNIGDPYRTKNLCSMARSGSFINNTNNTLSLKFASINGNIIVKGHGAGNTPQETFYYLLNITNGTCQAINLVSNSTVNLEFEIVQYQNSIYTMHIKNIPQYSAFSIELPPYENSGILYAAFTNK